MISIAALVFRDPRYADFVYKSLHKHTPELEDGRAEFFFVANTPNAETWDHLCNRGYRAKAFYPTRFSDAELAAKGVTEPEYIHRVYRAWNLAMSEARGDTIVLLNSDMAVSPGWLRALLEQQDGRSCVVSQLVEYPPECAVRFGNIPRDFGGSLDDFSEAAFLTFAASIRQEGCRPGGSYMPMCIPSALVQECGMFPEGNIGGRPGDEVYRERLGRLGVRSVTATGSIVYHMGRGESREGRPAGIGHFEDPA